MSFVSYFTHAAFSSPSAMLRSIGYQSEGNGSFRVIIDVEPVIIQFLLHLNIPSFLAFGHAMKHAAAIPILQQPLPSIHNLILHWFVTLSLVESSEVRACSFSISDVMLMATLSSVPDPTHVIQTNCLSTWSWPKTTPESKRAVCFNSTGLRHCVPRKQVVGISRCLICISMPNDHRKVTVMVYVAKEYCI